MINDDLNKSYLKVVNAINKVSKLYMYENLISKDVNTSYKKYYFNDNLIYSFYNTNNSDYDLLDLLELNIAILRALGIKEYKLLINEKYLDITKDLGLKIEGYSSLDYIIEVSGYEIKCSDNHFTLDIEKIIQTGICKITNKQENIHVLFIADNEELLLPLYKVMNVCRIGGLVCEMNLHLEAQFDLTSRFTCYLDKDMFDRYVINICDNIVDRCESVSIYDVYPYILNKLNKIGSCATCQTKE